MATENRRQFQRRRTGAQWTSENPVLAAGEIGVATGGYTPEVKIGDGTTAWNALLGPDVRHPMVFWRHDTVITVPNDVWTPMPWNNTTTTKGVWNSYAAASTTIAAGSNGAALPQATINVASTTGFATSGFLVITISATHRVVAYTGKNATQFTGCTLGVGTMTTGDAVAQANVDFTMPGGGVAAATTEVAWASNATGVRGVRFRFIDGVFNFPGGTDVRAAFATPTGPLMRCVANEQPATSNNIIRIEGYQSSGGNLNTALDLIAAPRLVMVLSSAFTV